MRILLADDRPEIRSALRLLLEQDPDVTVAGEAAAVEDLLVELERHNPDLLLLDWELPGLEAGEERAGDDGRLLAHLSERCPELRVVALSGRPEAQEASLAAGASAFVSKCDPPERLLAVLHKGRS
ncbi:MAG: response regulator [Chloroflexota bacterium]